MKIKRALFVGWYPNPIDEYRNIFFQNLIFAIADTGIECHVISPVSIMKYCCKVKEIPHYINHTTREGNIVNVYYPRVLSASSKQILDFNTELISERLFEQGALSAAKRLKLDFDFVYGHFFLYGGLAAIKIGRMLGKPSFIAYGECDCISQLLNTYGSLKASDIKGLYGIISVSKKNTEELVEMGIFSDIPILTCPNAIDTDKFGPLDKKKCRRKLGMPQERFIVGFVGGFIDRKGDKRLLAACNKLNDIYVAFAGTGTQPPRGDKVVFCKALPHDEICIFLNAVDVFVLPTTNEGCCNAIIEAMACGLPVISSDLPFNDGILNDDNSIRIDPMNVEQIGDAIVRLYYNPGLRESMSQASLKIAKGFDIKQRAVNILEFVNRKVGY